MPNNECIFYNVTNHYFEIDNNDCLTLKPMLQKSQKDYSVGKVTVVANKRLNTSKNIVYQKAIGNGYIMSIRNTNQELKDFFNKDDYTYNSYKTYKKITPLS